MTAHETYTFILCLIVMVAFTATFSYLIASNLKMHLKMIELGQLDEDIKKSRTQPQKPKAEFVCRLLSWVLMIAMIVVFAVSMCMYLQPDCGFKNLPALKVVKSTSMQKAHEKNTYLAQNGIDDHLKMFDLILVRPMPAEDRLELYDVVVYQKDDTQIIHRIIGIEEPNAQHPDERQFLLKGDANLWEDEFPVLYSQMQGIYEGERVPFAGSFVMFMQSPAGWLCILLVVFAVFVTPAIEKKILAEYEKRLAVLFPEPDTQKQHTDKA